MINTDLSRRQEWRAVKGFDNQFTLTFLESGSAFDVSDFVFTVGIRRIGDSENVVELTEGDGITNGGASGIVTILLDETASDITAQGYFYEITYVTGAISNRLIQGTFNLVDDYNIDNVTRTLSIDIDLEGTDVNLSVTLGGITQSELDAALDNLVASQSEVNGGTVINKYVSPSTLHQFMGLYYSVRVDFLGLTDGAEESESIQQIIDDNVGSLIIIPFGVTYYIKKALVIPSGTMIQQDGILILVDGNEQLLTSNVIGGQSYADVVDASGFTVGQRIVISDDNQPINGGGAWKTRKVGRTNTIASIVGNRLNFDHAFASNILGSGSFTVAANGKVAIAENIYLIDGVSNVTIILNGELDGNRANQYNIAGAYYDGSAEDLKSSSGIMFSNCDHINIIGRGTIKDFILHGISTNDNATASYSEFYTIQGITIEGQVDKAITGIRGKNFLIEHVTNLNGTEEGEIMMYADNINGTVRNCFSKGNRRHGIATAGISNRNIIIDNCTFEDNQTTDLFIQNALTGTLISNVQFTGTAANSGALVLSSSSNVEIKNVNIWNKTNASALIGIGTGDSIHIDGLNIKDCNLSVVERAISIGAVTNCVIENFKIDGVGRVFNDGASNGFVRFIKGNIINYTTLFETDNSKFIFSKVNGIVTENASSATIASGKTSVIINHLMTRTPLAQNIKVTPTNSMGNATKFWISEINANTFKINVDVDPGATTATFRWEIETYMGDVTAEPAYTINYSSDFSAGVDSFASTRVVTSGNNDGISDGTTSLNDVLKTYADANNNSHFLQRASSLFVGKLNRITFKCYIPNAQTNVNGFRVYHTSASTVNVVADLRLTLNVVGTWTEYTTAYFTPTGNTLVFDLWKTFTSSYAGANSASDDIIYFKDIVVEYLP